IRILPAIHEQKLFDWLSNKDPWCLSRQLLWGHRIPAYRSEGSSWFIAKSLDDARKQFGKDAVIVQDDDVLDTWFSSSLIPLVNAGWPSSEFNPSSPLLDVMETGWDILGFWVARMIIVTMRLSGGQVPFSTVLLHGLVRDSSGKKMSKSLGNVIDPLDVVDGISREKMIERIERSNLSKEEIEAATSAISIHFPEGIARAGPDALRFALLRHDLLASDIPLKVAELSNEGLRFCNKLWNMVAYVETVTENSHTLKDVDSEHPAETTKRALWDKDLARIEEIRTTLNRVVQPTLVQLSVFMPFVAEHLYERLFKREPGSIYFDFVKASFFQLQRSTELESDMDILLGIVSTSSHRSDFVSRLQRLLKKYEERSEQFRRKAEKYEAIVLRDKQEGKVKPHIIDKNEKKARQARGVVQRRFGRSG
ncbi:hypothetical protein COOONC_14530, partial [Cooperia oncophora]